MEKEPKPLSSIEKAIVDANGQISQFQFYEAEQVKEILRNTQLKSLEEYTGRTTEEIEQISPYVSAVYNDLIKELKEGLFDDSRLKEIIQEASDVTHGR